MNADLTTIVNSLFIYQHQNPASNDVDLADALKIPDLNRGTFVVEAPCFYQMKGIR